MKTKWLIIGSGPGAASAAHVLSQHFGAEVTLVEEGSDPLRSRVKPHGLSEMRQFMKNAGLNYVLGKPPLILSEAKVLGGGSQINSGLYWPLPEDVREEWKSAFEMEKFSAAEILPFQNQAEAILKLHDHSPEADLFKAMKISAERLGYEWRSPKVWWTENSRGGLREKLITQCETRGMHLLTGQKVLRIEKSNSGWRVHTTTTLLECEKLVVGAGVFATQDLVSSFCTAQKVYFHPQIRLLARFPEASFLETDRVVPYQMKNGGSTLGFSSRSPNHIIGFFGHRPELMQEVEDRSAELISLYGTVGLKTTIQKIPGTRMRWVWWQKKDQDRLVSVMRDLIRLVQDMGAKEFIPVTKNPVWNGSEINFKDLKLTSVHIMGGIGMGENSQCLADSFGRVKKIANLYISDASLLNGSPGLNPQGTIMMLALRNATEWIKD